MQRTLRIWLEWHGESIEVPELFSRLTINKDAPPIPHYIVGKGRVYAPSHDVPPVITLDNLQAWQQWIERHIDNPMPPRAFLDKIAEIRASLDPVRFVIESEKYETYNIANDFLALINLREESIENGEEHDIYYSLDFYKFEDHEMKELQVEYSGDETIVREPAPERIDERPANPRTHTVVSGDNLTRIARQFGQPDNAWRELYALNKEVIHSRGNQNLIFPGQIFQIPEGWL